MEIILTEWQKELAQITPSNAQNYADKAVTRLKEIADFLNTVAYAVNSFTPVDFNYETTVTGYKTSIDAARTAVDTARSALITAKDSFSARGGESQGDARIDQINASIEVLETSISKSKIIAPFSGVVTKQDAKVGEAVISGESLVSIITEGDIYIEANISEINIGKIMTGDPASVTFDAFPNEEFKGEVSYIEPGDVIIDGVVNYKIRVNLPDLDSKVKTGLTANIKIQTDEKRDVLAVPLYTVSKENGRDFVSKVVGNSVEKVPVTLGISGNNGFAEVLSGLGEGDMIEF